MTHEQKRKLKQKFSTGFSGREMFYKQNETTILKSVGSLFMPE